MKEPRITGQLVGIPGVKSGRVDCTNTKSVTAMMRTVAPGLAACAAGRDGAISLWIGDDGDYLCDFSRFGTVQSQGSFAQKTKLRRWLQEHWPKMGDLNSFALMRP